MSIKRRIWALPVISTIIFGLGVADSAAVKKAVAADPKAIGYIEKSAADASVKVIFTAP